MFSSMFSWWPWDAITSAEFRHTRQHQAHMAALAPDYHPGQHHTTRPVQRARRNLPVGMRKREGVE